MLTKIQKWGNSFAILKHKFIICGKQLKREIKLVRFIFFTYACFFALIGFLNVSYGYGYNVVLMSEPQGGNPPYKSIENGGNSILSGVKLLGTFAASYTYNFANPSSTSVFPYGNKNGNYIDNYQVNGSTINEFDLTISKKPSVSNNFITSGFKITLDTGQNIQDVGPYTGNYSYYTQYIYDRQLWGFRQAYLSFRFPIGSGLKMEVGEKNYLIGYESYNLSRAWNNTYSLITAIEPGELTGIFFNYRFLPNLKSTLGFAFTDNAIVPINRYPTYEFILVYKPLNYLKFHEGIVYGAENFIIYKNNLIPDNMNKFFYNFIDAKFSYFNGYDFVLDYEVGLNGGINKSFVYNYNNDININDLPLNTYPDQFVSTSNATFNKSRFSGIAFYIHHYKTYNFGRFSQTLRLTDVSDPQGLWEMSSVPGEAFHYFDSTFTLGLRPNLRIMRNLQYRLEFERQISNQNIYGDGNSSQNTINLMMIYTF